MLEKRDLQLVRLAVRRQWLSAEEGEDCLFLKRKFESKYTIEEIIRRRQYLDDEAIVALSEAADEVIQKRGRTAIFRRAKTPPAPPRRVTRAPPRPIVAPSVQRATQSQARGALDGQAADARVGGSAASQVDGALGGAVPYSEGSDDVIEDGDDKTSVVSLADLRPELQGVLRPDDPPELDPALLAEALNAPIDSDRTIVDANILAALEARAKAKAAERKTDPPAQGAAPVSGGFSVPQERTSIGVVSGAELLARPDGIPRAGSGIDIDLQADLREPSAVSRDALMRPPSMRGAPLSDEIPLVRPVPPSAPPPDVITDPEASPSPGRSGWATARTASGIEAVSATSPLDQGSGMRASPMFHAGSGMRQAPILQSGSGMRQAPILRAGSGMQRMVRPQTLDPLDQPVGPEDEFEDGMMFGRYFIQRRIARGGMGIVYLAQTTDGAAPVALKVLKSSVIEAPEFVARFKRESAAAAAIDSPHVVKIKDVGEVDGRNFIAMEYVDGWTLKERFESGDSPSLGESLRIGQDVARALAAAAEQGVIHRDVKPDNVMITRDGRVLLTDFGLAKELRDAGNVTPASEVIVGTPNYMAPEQAVGKLVDHRADLYALGATLFHMLVGRPVYPGRSSVSIIAKHISREVPDVHAIDSKVPQPVADLIGKLLAKFPEERYANAAELVDALEVVINGLAPDQRELTQHQPHEVSLKAVTRGTGLISLAGLGMALAVPLAIELLALVQWQRPVALLRTAFMGASGLGFALLLFVGLGLVRRGQLPLPGSTSWLVYVKDVASALGAASLVAGVVLGPPAVMNVMVSILAAVLFGSLAYGILLRREIALSRPDRGVGRMLAVLGDHRLKRWRRMHAPLLTSVVFLSTTRWALLAYFHATGWR